MRTVPSSTKLSKISIPGTHDSISQVTHVSRQLVLGIRFIDIVIEIDMSNGRIFKIHDDNPNQNMSLTDLLNLIKEFLIQFTSEAVILNWKVNDQWAIQNFKDLDQVFKVYSEEPHNLIYVGTHSNAEYSTPTLREVRGKIVLINYKKSLSTGSKAFNSGLGDEENPKTDENLVSKSSLW